MVKYRSFSHSTIGARHIKNDLPCQDASLNNDENNDGRMSVAVIADGHGSPQHFRSDIGSEAAAEIALTGIKEFIEQNQNVPEAFVNGGGKKALDQLAKHIISAWVSRVSDDEIAFPLAQDTRMAAVEDKHKTEYLNDPDHQNFCHAYGTTLIAVAMTDDYWFGFHIGDGKCEVLYEDGTWEQPIPWDDKCFLNSTTSICDDNSISEFRYWFGFRQEDGSFAEYRYGVDGQNRDNSKILRCKPIAVFIGSDGVDDTYPVHENEKHLKYLYRSIVLSFAATGFEKVSAQILELSKRLAQHGSQDDISIAGIIGDLQANSVLIENLTLQAEADKTKEKAIEERKKADAKKLLIRAEQAKADSLKKRIADLLNKAQIAEQEYEHIRSHIRHLEEDCAKKKKDIASAEQNRNEKEKLLKQIEADLKTAEKEEKSQNEKLQADKEELAAVESQARQLEEQSHSGETRLQELKSSLLQFGRDVGQTLDRFPHL
jgi:hypothetical protein